MYGIAEIAIECRGIIMRARIQFPLYVAGRRVKVVPRYALGFHLDPPPGSGTFAFRISREECDVQQKVVQCRLTTGQFAGTSDNFLRCHFQGGSQSKQSVQGGISQASLDKSHGLPVNTRLLSEQIQGNAAFLPFCFQQAGDLRTDGFRHSVDWHTEAIQKIWLTIDATLVAYHRNTSFPRRKIGEGLNEARVTESVEA
jgi:hypothetical protein